MTRVLPKSKKRNQKKLFLKKGGKQVKIKNQDYRGRILEVLDSNRIRVGCRMDGVNVTKHKGSDDRRLTFQYWRVNYEKTNIERFKTYMVCDNDYYLLVNDRLNVR